MPKRPRSHQLEDLARNQLHAAFVKEGWSVEDLDKDYGEDLLVRIFKNGIATPYSFFIQSKATDHIEKYLSKDRKHYLYPIKTDHIEYWNKFWEPVILALWDSASGITYWESVQTFIEQNQGKLPEKRHKSLRVAVPHDNKLDEEGVKRIVARTISRFERFEREKVGAETLINILKKELGLELTYDPQFGFLLFPQGEFKANPDGGRSFIAFGKCAALLKNLQDKFGIEPQQAFLNSLDFFGQIIEQFKAGNTIALIDKNENIVQSWESLNELGRHIDRLQELDEIEKDKW